MTNLKFKFLFKNKLSLSFFIRSIYFLSEGVVNDNSLPYIVLVPVVA
jgi:hypothetical protein